ncbi:glycosyl hydrolase family 28 protein [Clostridium thermarum]|uniref:glycosyl hydrolase family 28 protein n=1 Tax=Clostridium thermarum TaxID=1716543 RepID=UPI0011205344|nr:glycosyl hydrolase family 28 protein [Clostridium thermarum]
MEVMTVKEKSKLPILILAISAILSVAFATYRIVDLISNSTKATLVLYDGPKLMRQAGDTKISVNGNPLFVYNAPVNNTHTWVENGNPPMDYTAMTYFDFEGTAKIEIELTEVTDISKVKVSPLSAGIKPKVNGNKITFTVKKPDQYTVEYNDSVETAIHIFANPLEQDLPDFNDKNVIYVGPGLWNIDNVGLESGQTLYLSGGAVVYGTIRANNVENVTVRGRGIMDGSLWSSWKNEGQIARVPIDFVNSKNIYVEGIIFMNPNAWTFNSLSSENATIDNIKIISARQNGDGITLQSCKNFTVTNSFVRSWDDSLVVKNYEGNSDNITFDNIKVWTDLAQSCEIGYETNKGQRENAVISNITFKNITVLHNFHKPVISIHNSDDATVRDIRYSNIIVEDAQMGEGDAGANKQLIDFTIMGSGWSATKERGHIKNITVENVKILSGKAAPSRIIGFDKDHMVENVKIKGLNILGKDIKSSEDANLETNEYVSGIVFE